MDVASLIYEALQITYTFIPKELFLIMLVAMTLFIYNYFNGDDNAK